MIRTPVLLYITKCGCKLKETLRYKHGHRVCPEHKKSVVTIIKECLKCKIEMRLRPMQSTKVYCDDCYSEHNRRRAAEAGRKNRPAKQRVQLEKKKIIVVEKISKPIMINEAPKMWTGTTHWWKYYEKELNDYFKKLHIKCTKKVVKQINQTIAN